MSQADSLFSPQAEGMVQVLLRTVRVCPRGRAELMGRRVEGRAADSWQKGSSLQLNRNAAVAHLLPPS